MSEIDIIDPKVEKAFERIAERAIVELQKRDYRATIKHVEEQGQVPSDVATFVHIDERERDQLDNPVELDVKGTISSFEAEHFKDVSYAMALASLKNWAFFEEPGKDKEGEPVTIRTPINLAQIDMLAKKRLNLSRNGSQSEKHIRALQANSGKLDDAMQKTATWLGLRKQDKQQVQQKYQ